MLTSILTLCTIPACSPTNSDPKPVFVVPTNYGKECLKNSTIKKAKREPIWKDGTRYLADNAYEMTIYSTDKENKEIIKFKNDTKVTDEYTMILDLNDLKLILDTITVFPSSIFIPGIYLVKIETMSPLTWPSEIISTPASTSDLARSY